MAEPKIQTIVVGEACESDEEEDAVFVASFQHSSSGRINEEINISDKQGTNHEGTASDNTGKSSLQHQSIVSGEASESDEEEIVTGEEPLKTLYVDENGKGDQHEGSVVQEHIPQKKTAKYDSILHWKLAEKNAALYKNLCDMAAQAYLSSARELKNMTQQLSKSQLAIQEVSHHTRLVTNDLFYLEDKIDIVSSCSLLPVISVEKLPTFTQGGATHSPTHNATTRRRASIDSAHEVQ